MLIFTQNGVYYRLGQLMAMALLQGGSSLNILTQSVINYLCGMKPQDIVVGVNEIADVNLKRILEKV